MAGTLYLQHGIALSMVESVILVGLFHNLKMCARADVVMWRLSDVKPLRIVPKNATHTRRSNLEDGVIIQDMRPLYGRVVECLCQNFGVLCKYDVPPGADDDEAPDAADEAAGSVGRAAGTAADNVGTGRDHTDKDGDPPG